MPAVQPESGGVLPGEPAGVLTGQRVAAWTMAAER